MFFKLLKLITPYRWWMLLAAFLGFLTIGSSIGLMMTSAFIISKAALHPSIAELQVGIVGVRFFGITRGVFRYLERLVSHQTTFRILAEFRVWFYKQLQPLAPAGLQEHHSGDLQSQIISDIETLENFYQRVLYPPIVAVFVALLTFLVYGQFSLTIAVVVLLGMTVTGMLLPLLIVKHTGKLAKAITRQRAQLTRLSIEYIQGLADLLAFGRAHEWQKKIEKNASRLYRDKRRFAQIEGFYQALVGLFMNGTVFLTLYLSAPLVENRLLDGVYLAVLTLGVMAAFEAINPLPQAAQYWQENRASASRLFKWTQPHPSTFHLQESIAKKGIVFKDVSFSYENKSALTDINLHISPGEKILIVGASGSGKSTLVNLLLNFWTPQKGNVFVDGTHVSNYEQKELIKKIAVVPQNSYLFSASVKDNLLMRKTNAHDQELFSACQQAEFANVLEKLPEGLDTWVGEHGMRLSGGEQHRLALAQGFLQQSDYYVVDEPSANLDVELEEKIFQQLYAMPQTVIMISHRLVHVERADRIVLMQDGRIVAQGSFAELQSSILKDMLNIQNNYIT